MKVIILFVLILTGCAGPNYTTIDKCENIHVTNIQQPEVIKFYSKVQGDSEYYYQVKNKYVTATGVTQDTSNWAARKANLLKIIKFTERKCDCK